MQELLSSCSQEGLMANPQPKLEVFCCRWMCRASSTLIFQQFPSSLLVLAAFQSTWCWLVQVWAAIPLLVSCFFILFWCSLRRFSKALLVSPMYCIHPHSPCILLHRQHLSSCCLLPVGCFTCTVAHLTVMGILLKCIL